MKRMRADSYLIVLVCISQSFREDGVSFSLAEGFQPPPFGVPRHNFPLSKGKFHSQSSEERIRGGSATTNGPFANAENTVQKRRDVYLDNYYLVWSPGVMKKMLVTTGALLILPRLLPPILSKLAFPRTLFFPSPAWMTSFWRNLLLPLTASSCCLIQLGLNALSFGCAGWNSVLGPWRPYLLSFLFTSSFLNPPRALSTLMWRIGVAILPEMLHGYNEWQHSKSLMTASLSSSTTLSNKLEQEAAAKCVDVTLDIPTMGCIACIQSVNQALRQSPSVVHASSQLKPKGIKGGEAVVRLRVENPDDVSSHLEKLIQAIQAAGFDGAKVQSVSADSE